MHEIKPIIIYLVLLDFVNFPITKIEAKAVMVIRKNGIDVYFYSVIVNFVGKGEEINVGWSRKMQKYEGNLKQLNPESFFIDCYKGGRLITFPSMKK